MRVSKKMASSCNGKLDDLRRGPWTLDEDNLLIHHITCHGEGRWNSLAKSSGLKRTGKSCRLRWLNYLKPDVKHGNLTAEEQLLILELHSKWGNRWSKIAQNLPGRTDNEIKNYWRTKVQKQARHLKIDCNSKIFVEALRHFLVPRLLEKAEPSPSSSSTSTSAMEPNQTNLTSQSQDKEIPMEKASSTSNICSSNSKSIMFPYTPETSLQSNAYIVDYNNFDVVSFNPSNTQEFHSNCLSTFEFEMEEVDWMHNELVADDTLWNMDELWQFKK